MADYTYSKPAVGAVWHQREKETSWPDLEPLVTPEQIRSRHLFGIPLYSGIKDPVTGKRQEFVDAMIMDEIQGAVSDAELETHIDIFPRKYTESQPFDRAEYQSFGYFRLEHRPVYTIDKITVRTSNGIDVFTVPLQWVHTGQLVHGAVGLIPMGVALTGTGDPNSFGVVGGQTAGGAAFLAILGNQPWISSFWLTNYSAGFVDGALPRPVNELIGVIAAMRILSLLAATHAKTTSASVGIDGLSQGQSGPGPQIFSQRLQELAERRKTYVKKLKTMFGLNIFSGNV